MNDAPEQPRDEPRETPRDASEPRHGMPPLPNVGEPRQPSQHAAQQPQHAAQPQQHGEQAPQRNDQPQRWAPAQPATGPSRPYGVPQRGASQPVGQPQQPGQQHHGPQHGQAQQGQPQQGPSLSSQLGGTAATRSQGPSHPATGSHAQGQQPFGPQSQYGQPQRQQTFPQSQPHASAHPDGAPTPAPRKKRAGATPWLILALPVMLIIGAIAGYLLATNYNSFDNRAVEDAVAQVLRNDYGLSDLRSVDCPNWVKVEQGQSFQCEFEYAGGTQTVTVTQGSQSGQLVVGAPE